MNTFFAAMNLTTDPIPSLIKKIAVPAGVGMFFHTMYNLVDTYYAGTLSTEALSAISYTFALFLTVLSLGIGIGQGTNALIAHALGQENLKKAQQYQLQAIIFAVTVSILSSIIGMLFATPLLELMGAKGQELILAYEYIKVIIIGAVVLIASHVINSGLLAQGDSSSNRNALIGGFFLNLILDPLFLYGWGPIPEMGVAGIAMATVVIQLAVCWYLWGRLRNTPLLKEIKQLSFTPDFQVWKEIAFQGFPASLNMIFVSAGVFVITSFISRYHALAVSAYGVAIRIEQMVLLPAISLNAAALSITGQNFGSLQFDRVREVYQTCLKYGLIIMIIGAGLIFAFGREMMSIFSDDPKVIELGIQYLRIDAFVFPAYMLMFLSIAILQGLKKPLYGLYIGIFRQIAGPLIIFWFLAEYLGFELFGIWYGILITTWMAALMTAAIVRYTISTLHRNHVSTS